jgi:hypothetical protein
MRRALLALLILAVPREAKADEPSAPPPAAAAVRQDAASAPPRSPAPKSPESEPSAKQGEVFLHVTSSALVTVEREDTGEIVCTSPCDKTVPADVTYRVGGHRPSPSFALKRPENGRVDLHVKPGSKAGFWTGVGGVALGTALLGGGIATLIYGVANRNAVPGPDSETIDNSYTDVMTLGTVLILGGIFIGAGGGAFVASNASTSVSGDVRMTESPRVTGSRAGDAVPRSQPAPPFAALPRPTYVSIFSATF